MTERYTGILIWVMFCLTPAASAISPEGAVPGGRVAEPPVPVSSSRDSGITWAVEDWDGSYGAVVHDTAVTADGARIYVAWSLNYERIDAFDAAGNGSPLWSYDILESGIYYLSGDPEVAVSDDGAVVAAAFDRRVVAGDDHYHAMVFRLDASDGSVLWSHLLPATVQEPLNTERMLGLEVSADGSTIAVAAMGYRSDPVYEPFHFYIYDASGILLHTFEIQDDDGEISYFNDMKLTETGSRLVADFRRNTNPTHLVKVWDLVEYTEIQTFGINLSPPQCSIGLSGDGGILSLGDLKGHLRVYAYAETRGAYQLLWQYNIPLHTYYPWVDSTAVSRDGSVVAMGSYEALEEGEEDHLYVFRTDEGPEVLYKSPDFGGAVTSLALSHDGSVISAASYGPRDNPASGFDLLVYSTAVQDVLFSMEGTYPGSLMHCSMDASGTRVATGGKRVHAFEMGSGGWAYSIEVDASPPTHTPTPTVTPTFTASPTPTPTCPCSGAGGTLSGTFFIPGDLFRLDVTACNESRTGICTNPVFVILDVYGTYYFAPAWTTDVSYYSWSIPTCACREETILAFTWPEVQGHSSELSLYIAMTDPECSSIVGNITVLQFAW